MAGINSRTRFDTCDIDNILNITVNPGKYALSQDQISSNPFCVNNIIRGKNRTGRVSALDNKNASALVDIESQLQNLDVPYSQCFDTLDERNKKAQQVYNTMDMGVCAAEQLKTEYTKLDIPSNQFRSATSHRFDFPIIPPSDFTYFGIGGTEQVDNLRDGVNTRLQAKDKFRARV